MKLLADMGISPRSVEYLRSEGHDAVHLHELGLDTLSDPKILEMARIEGRVVLTHDLDFGELVAASGALLPSVITFRLRDMRAIKVNQYLQSILLQYSGELKRGVVMTVTEGRIRVRSLPMV